MPETGREFLIRHGLVLHMHHGYRDSQFFISFHEFHEIPGIGIQHRLFHAYSSKVIYLLCFHPRRRAPWGGKQSQIRAVFLRRTDKRHRVFLIPLHVKILQLIIAVRIITAVPFQAEVIGPDGDTSHIEGTAFGSV